MNQNIQNKKNNQEDKRDPHPGVDPDASRKAGKNPSYETEKKENEKFSRSPDAGNLKRSGSSQEDADESQQTSLNESAVQEGGKGRRSA